MNTRRLDQRSGLLCAALVAAACTANEPPPVPTVSISPCPAGARDLGGRCVALEPTAARAQVAVDPEGAVEASAKAQALAGDYEGEFSHGGAKHPIETRWVVRGDAMSGTYAYGQAEDRMTGLLTACRRSLRQVSCTWSEGSIEGALRVRFDERAMGFAGDWYFADGSAGGTWYGRRVPAVARPEPDR